MTPAIDAAPTRIRSMASPRTSTASAAFPGSRLPTWAALSRDQAALIVAAASAYSNVMPMPKQASVIAKGIDGEKPPPGLTSVASATGTEASMNARAGANRPSFR